MIKKSFIHMGAKKTQEPLHELNGIPIIEAPVSKPKTVFKKPVKKNSVKQQIQQKRVKIAKSVEVKQRKESLLDKEIKINARGIFRGSVLVILLLAVFMAGRWSIDSPQMDITGLVTFADNIKEKVTTEPIEEVVVEETAIEVVTEPDPPVEEEVIEEEPEVEEENEPVITTYNNVEFIVSDVNIDWKGTWGKVTQVTYMIINNEEGTIEPDHLIMQILPAYEDIEKKIPLPLSAKSLKSGQKYSHTINIPGGFAYNELTVGSLTSVPITVYLEDASNKRLDGHTSGFNIQG
jgi:hypothetical protein